MTASRSFLALFVACGLSACSSNHLDVGSKDDAGPAADASAGAHLQAASAIASFGQLDGRNLVSVLISDKANTCALVHQASSQWLYLEVRSTAPGTFPINVTNDGPISTYQTYNRYCHDTGDTSGEVKSGTISLTSVSPTKVTGTYDLIFEEGHFTGTFDAPVCSGLPLFPSDGDGGTLCVP